MKKIISICFISLLVSSCTNESHEIFSQTNVSLIASTTSMTEGNSQNVQLVTNPEIVTDTVIWLSSAPEIAAVDRTGKVTAISPGKATISASFNNKVADLDILVEAKTMFTLSKMNITIEHIKEVLDNGNSNYDMLRFNLSDPSPSDVKVDAFQINEEDIVEGAIEYGINKEIQLYKVTTIDFGYALHLNQYNNIVKIRFRGSNGAWTNYYTLLLGLH